MKYIKERTEIAKFLNFNNYPVLTINREDHKGFDNSDFAQGCDVRCEYSNNYGTRFTQGCIEYYNGEYSISSKGVMITDGFGSSQILKMAHWANTPIIKANQIVVVIEEYPSQKGVSVRIMKTGEKVNPFCATALKLIDID